MRMSSFSAKNPRLWLPHDEYEQLEWQPIDGIRSTTAEQSR